MAPGSLAQKIREAAKEANQSQANLSKEHIVVTYSFGGKQGQRVLRCEGTDAFGSALYFDYRTNTTKSLEAHARYWGVTGLKETHKADLVKLRATREGVDENPQVPIGPVQREEPPAQDSSNIQQTPSQVPDSSSSQPEANRQSRPPHSPRHSRRRQPPANQKPLDGKINPKPSELKAPVEPPQGRPAGTTRTSALKELSRPSPIFDYFRRYYPDTVHCASIAWGITMSYLCAEIGRSSVIYPVSSWKLRDYVTNKKNKEIAALVNPLDIKVKTNKDYYLSLIHI